MRFKNDMSTQEILSEAVLCHKNWISAIKTFAEGTAVLTDMEISSPDECKLGHWMNEDGLKEFGQYPEFVELKANHRTLHELGKKLVEKKHEGDMETVKKILEELQPISKIIVAHIEALKAKK